MNATDVKPLPSALFWILILLCLLPWFVVQAQMSLTGDTTWLIAAAERFLRGETMAEGFYETNPPLSVLYHVPPVILAKLLPVPSYYIIFFYFAALMALSTWAVNSLARRFDFMDMQQRYVLLAAWLAGNTYFTALAFGQREHIVILGLMPFLLAQLLMTWKYDTPKKLFWIVMVAGTVAALVKPHFGLLPTAMLVHRMVVQKRFWSIIRDPDFIILAIGTLAYIACVWFFFRDYVTVILPDVLNLYVVNRDLTALPELITYTYLFLITACIEAFFSPLKGRQKQFLLFLYAGAILSLVPYAVQMKGFYYHLVPALALYFSAFSMSFYSYARVYLEKFKYTGAITVIAIFVMAAIFRPLLITYPKHKDHLSLPLTKEVAKCEKPCPYFIFNGNMEILHPLVFYTGVEHASRFPTYWFAAKLIQDKYKLENGEPTDITWEELNQYRKKYGDMTAEDLRRYKPKMILIGLYEFTPDEKTFDFAAFWEPSAAFQQEWAHYEKDRTITINRDPYFKGTALEGDFELRYDVYYRDDTN